MAVTIFSCLFAQTVYKMIILLYWTWLILLISDLPVGAKKRIETNDVIYVQYNKIIYF